MNPKFFKVNTSDKELNQIQDNLVRTLNPVIETPILGGTLLQSVALVTGSNVINHKLGRKLIGWVVSRQRSAANIYDDQDNNSTPQLNLILVTSADVILDIYCF